MSNGLASPSVGKRIVTFLHLSDLHVGMGQDKWLWPTFATAFYADLRRLLPVAGLPDLVIFSGDLVQRAAVEEYDRLTQILVELWGVFRELGCNPLLVPVPGNHDLLRPAEDDVVPLLMRQWWDLPSVSTGFWAKKDEYVSYLSKAFAPYRQFVSALAAASIPLPPTMIHGLIPGDVSASVTVGDHSVGIIGLNSTWLQVGAGNFEAKLAVDPRQLMAVVDHDPDNWCRQHQANLLVTHHPDTWLHPDSYRDWRSEIFTSGRFDCHLFGHMHEQRSTVLSTGGYEGRRQLQAASLFGLEWIAKGKLERLHGYSLNTISEEGGSRRLRQWPRTSVVGTDGVRKLAPNTAENLTEGNYFDVSYGADRSLPSPARPAPTLNVFASDKVLDALRRVLPSSEPARHIRKVEQQAMVEPFINKRAIWLVADWGSGADHFLDAFFANLAPSKPLIFQIDIGGYSSRDAMLDGIHSDLGVGFQQLCDTLSRQSDAVLIFDDVEVGSSNGEVNLDFLRALDDIADAVLQYCPNVRLVFRSRRRPFQTRISVIELTALNDLDAMLYIQNHPDGGVDLANEAFVRRILSHTDGLPARMDDALRDVALVGVEGLHLVNTDVVGKGMHLHEPPPGLAETVAQLEAEGPESKRAARLLTVLALFPRGEYYEFVRRFDNSYPFHPKDGRRLVDLGLVDTSEIPNLGSTMARASAKSLIVKRPVREYILGTIEPVLLDKLNREALRLYFGDEWSTGAIKPPKGTRFDERACEPWKIDNATLLIMREAKDAIDEGTELRISNAAKLANSYCGALYNGEHYERLVRAASDFLTIYRGLDGHDQRRINIQALLGRALRMCGEREQCIAILGQVVEAGLSNAAKSSALVSMMLAAEALELNTEAVAYAKQCIALATSKNEVLQARSVIASVESQDDPKRSEKLLRMARKASKEGATIIASNLRLQCEAEEDDEQKRLTLAKQVLDDAKKSGEDQYNAMRAMLRICKITLSNGTALKDSELREAMGAYHYLLNETMDGLFNQAHRVLWNHFALTDDLTNLVSLFRHSSFKWQLRGKESIDNKYAAEIVDLLTGKLHGHLVRASPGTEYLTWRTGQNVLLLE